MHVRMGLAAGLADAGAGAVAATVQAIAGMGCQIGRNEPFQKKRMTALGVIALKMNHCYPLSRSIPPHPKAWAQACQAGKDGWGSGYLAFLSCAGGKFRIYYR